MKKIAILTLPSKNNYGGILQNFALQTFLEEKKFEVETINRVVYKGSSVRKALSHVKKILLSLLRKKSFLNEKDLLYINENTLRFIKAHLKKTEELNSTMELKNHFKKKHYDAIIVGSDQTWRPAYSPNILNYYFDFLKTNDKITKISYACSFGVDYWEYNVEQTSLCRSLIKDFDAISVREVTAIKLCKENLEVDVDLVLDPTLLLQKGDYLKIVNPNFNKTGIFTYILDSDECKSKIIDSLSAKILLPVFSSQPKYKLSQGKIEDLNQYKFPPVEDWISSFNNADFVITDSFHGMVFSIIFNKQFVILPNSGRGLARFNSLLDLLNIKNRIIYSLDDLERNPISEKINFSEVNRILDTLRAKSINFLFSSLNHE